MGAPDDLEDAGIRINRSVTVQRIMTPRNDDKAPPKTGTTIESHPTTFRKMSDSSSILSDIFSHPDLPEARLRQRIRLADHGSTTRHDAKDLVDFLRNVTPPPGNYMSVPDQINSSEDGSSTSGSSTDRWGLPFFIFRRNKRGSKGRSKSKRKNKTAVAMGDFCRKTSTSSRKRQPRRPVEIQLPDSAVAGRTIGGHRHIAISIPLEYANLGGQPRDEDLYTLEAEKEPAVTMPLAEPASAVNDNSEIHDFPSPETGEVIRTGAVAARTGSMIESPQGSIVRLNSDRGVVKVLHPVAESKESLETLGHLQPGTRDLSFVTPRISAGAGNMTIRPEIPTENVTIQQRWPTTSDGTMPFSSLQIGSTETLGQFAMPRNSTSSLASRGSGTWGLGLPHRRSSLGNEYRASHESIALSRTGRAQSMTGNLRRGYSTDGRASIADSIMTNGTEPVLGDASTARFSYTGTARTVNTPRASVMTGEATAASMVNSSTGTPSESVFSGRATGNRRWSAITASDEGGTPDLTKKGLANGVPSPIDEETTPPSAEADENDEAKILYGRRVAERYPEATKARAGSLTGSRPASVRALTCGLTPIMTVASVAPVSQPSTPDLLWSELAASVEGVQLRAESPDTPVTSVLDSAKSRERDATSFPQRTPRHANILRSNAPSPREDSQLATSRSRRVQLSDVSPPSKSPSIISTEAATLNRISLSRRREWRAAVAARHLEMLESYKALRRRNQGSPVSATHEGPENREPQHFVRHLDATPNSQHESRRRSQTHANLDVDFLENEHEFCDEDDSDTHEPPLSPHRRHYDTSSSPPRRLHTSAGGVASHSPRFSRYSTSSRFSDQPSPPLRNADPNLEARLSRLERNGDAWLGAIVPLFETLDRSLRRISEERTYRKNKSASGSTSSARRGEVSHRKALKRENEYVPDQDEYRWWARRHADAASPPLSIARGGARPPYKHAESDSAPSPGVPWLNTMPGRAQEFDPREAQRYEVRAVPPRGSSLVEEVEEAKRKRAERMAKEGQRWGGRPGRRPSPTSAFAASLGGGWRRARTEQGNGLEPLMRELVGGNVK